jgi:transposase InsO family protein
LLPGVKVLFKALLSPIKNGFKRLAQNFQERFVKWTTPLKVASMVGTLTDIAKTKKQLLTENALLRQQLIVLNRQVNKPEFKPLDRFIFVILASLVKEWKQALLILKPDTLLRWHRQGFKLLWKLKSKAHSKERKPKISEETITLIKKLAKENKLWGAERIRGELLKLNIKVAKRTIQKYMRQVRTTAAPTGQTWNTFLKNHANEIWACDFLPITNLFFKQIYAFFIVEHGSRKVVHFGVTSHPTQQWVTQQFKEATPFDHKPKYLIRDRDSRFGHHFDAVAKASGIEVLKTAYRTPKMNAICERFLGSVRRECLDHLFVFSERQLGRVLKEYVLYFNQQRPHQGIKQAVPALAMTPAPITQDKSNVEPLRGKVIALPILGGLHHSYEWAA